MKRNITFIVVSAFLAISLLINVTSFIGYRSFEQTLYRLYKEELINLDKSFSIFSNSTTLEEKETKVTLVYQSLYRLQTLGDVISERISRMPASDVHVFVAIPYEFLWMMERGNLLYENPETVQQILKVYITVLTKLEPFNDKNVRENYHHIHNQIRDLKLDEEIVPRQVDIY